jgi:hypothetical protein
MMLHTQNGTPTGNRHHHELGPFTHQHLAGCGGKGLKGRQQCAHLLCKSLPGTDGKLRLSYGDEGTPAIKRFGTIRKIPNSPLGGVDRALFPTSQPPPIVPFLTEPLPARHWGTSMRLLPSSPGRGSEARSSPPAHPPPRRSPASPPSPPPAGTANSAEEDWVTPRLGGGVLSSGEFGASEA